MWSWRVWFIARHLVNRLKSEGYWVRGVDLKENEYGNNNSDEFIVEDLRDSRICNKITKGKIDEVYQLAADMGGAGYIFTGEHDADVMHNSALCNLNMLHSCQKAGINFFFIPLRRVCIQNIINLTRQP